MVEVVLLAPAILGAALCFIALPADNERLLKTGVLLIGVDLIMLLTVTLGVQLL